ncbi:MCE family protein [Gordonia sp. (in: high G+C Gram-positive bacteria)]|uniref:MCE family protein n=1 Tax=Gordonia sp. (in: high G+C Gram-positive bacteria) TaxID=84139 RepID=UPI003F974BF1
MTGRSRRVHLAYAAGAVVAVVALVIVALVSYSGGFQSTTRVYLDVPRAGLMMQPGSDVKVSGVVVGRVVDIRAQGDGARLTLDVQSGAAERMPVDVSATLEPTTIFGRKFVELTVPTTASSEKLHDGAVIDTLHRPVEVDDTFRLLLGVLDHIDPADVGITLTALDKATASRGDTLGKLVESTNDYLGSMNKKLPTLQRDLRLGADNLETFADLTPDLMKIIKNVNVTSRTVVDKKSDLATFLLSFTRFGNTGSDFTRRSGKPLVEASDALAPTLLGIEEYGGTMPCFFSGMNYARKYLEQAFGGKVAGLNVLGTLLLGNPPYRPGTDAPTNHAGRAGASCYGYPFAPGDQGAGHFSFDDGSHAYRNVRTPDDVIGNPFASLIYGMTR